jgi:hypothetical protein
MVESPATWWRTPFGDEKLSKYLVNLQLLVQQETIVYSPPDILARFPS